ncbi:hypothetical protein R3X27_12775 [Tropicimonas sp. TH_r6]|uniref:hypothetical protein n=1 Tax=Tropicimonas sp. TH_r6 TaxID=3082085 RepID=UPI00295539D4|nr:hypothetical protein [Tropicimonas sp. TH_r6]MDV7143553.1 hypothetical protein [Tropicimonas sp. TH_r6]
MPSRYLFRHDLDLTLLWHTGHVTAMGQRQTLAALSAEPSFRPDARLLVDVSGIVSTDVEFGTLLERRKTHAGHLAELEQPTRWSYFAPTALGYGLSRRAQMLFDALPNLEIGVFWTSQEALDFLDLTASDLPGWPEEDPAES